MSEVVQSGPVVLYHPNGKKVALEAGELPRLEMKPQKELPAQLEAAWNVRSWLLHDGGLPFGRAGEPRFQALDEELPAGLTWGTRDIPPLLKARPWQLPGWPAQAREQLAGRGWPEVTQIFSTDLNTVLHAQKGGVSAYFKQSFSPRETQVTAYLGYSLPTLLPPLLAADEAGHWQLLASGGTLLDGVGDLSAWTQALERLARFQLTADASALADLGCPAYPLAAMSGRISDFVSDTATLHGWGLEPEKIAALQDALPRIRHALTDLQALNLPDLPAHGDAHPRNALYGERGSVWFDWSECASAAHPLMDAGWFLWFALHPSREKLAVRQAYPDLETRLSRAYLAALGCPDGESWLRQAPLLALLHRATVYDEHFRHWQGTVPGVRPNYVPYYLRQAVRELVRLD